MCWSDDIDPPAVGRIRDNDQTSDLGAPVHQRARQGL
jgi:hypothetical protein